MCVPSSYTSEILGGIEYRYFPQKGWVFNSPCFYDFFHVSDVHITSLPKLTMEVDGRSRDPP